MERAIEIVHGRGTQRPRTFAGGMDVFGLQDPIIAALLQDLPDAARCRGHDPELSAAPPSLTSRWAPPLGPRWAPGVCGCGWGWGWGWRQCGWGCCCCGAASGSLHVLLACPPACLPACLPARLAPHLSPARPRAVIGALHPAPPTLIL
jgi:hypothetical protein